MSQKRRLKMSAVSASREMTSFESGMSVVETLVAALIVVIASLGLGRAIYHLSQSRQKAQIISQAVGVEASLTSALQDPGTYMTNSGLIDDIKAGQPPDDAHQPTITVMLDSSVTPQKTFSIKAGDTNPVYITKDNAVLGGPPSGNNWTVSVMLSKLNYDAGTTKAYSYAYNIHANPALVNMAELGVGSSKILAPDPTDYSVSIPTQSLIVLTTGKSTCDANLDIGIMGIGKDGSMTCVSRAKYKCAKGSISKGLYLNVDPTKTPVLYSYEMMCQTLRTLTCPTQLTDGGVPDPTLYNPYSLQSFIPNTLDNSGPLGGTGLCVFMSAAVSSTHTAGSTMDGILIKNACPPHYVVTSVQCTADTASSTAPSGSPVVCDKADPAASIAPGGAIGSLPDPRSVLCQRQEYQSCCGDDHSKCAPIWPGPVSLSYTCTLNGTTAATVNAISN